MHVVKKVTMKCPVPRLVGCQIKLGTCTWLNHNNVFTRLAHRTFAVDQFEEHTMQVNRVRHHRVVHQLDTHALVPGKTDRNVVN